MWFWNQPKKRNERSARLDFFAMETLYSEGRELFLQGKHEASIECFKRIYEESAGFLDVSDIVVGYYAESKDQWIKRNQTRFKDQNR